MASPGENSAPHAPDAFEAGRTGTFVWLDRVLLVFVAVTMFAMMAVVFVDVIGRYFFNSPLPGGFEIVQFLMPLAIFTALPLVTRDGEHITASLFEHWIRGGFKRVIDEIILAFNVVVLCFVAYRMWVEGGKLAEADKISGFLEWPFAPIAYAIAVLAGLTALVQLIVMLRPLFGADRR